MSPYPKTEALFSRLWKEEVAQSGIEREELEKAYERQEFDDPSTLGEQLSWLRQAGFAQVDCVYRYYVFAAIYARKAD